MPTLAICIMSPHLICITSMASICLLSFQFWSAIWWSWVKSWSINSIPVTLQSISTCVGISWLFIFNVQVITKCFPSTVPSNTSTLLSERHEIPKDFEAFETRVCPSANKPSCFDSLNLFPIPWNLSQFLPLQKPLQPPPTSKSSSFLLSPRPCGYTSNSTYISHPWICLVSPLQMSFSCLHWDPWVQVLYICKGIRPCMASYEGISVDTVAKVDVNSVEQHKVVKVR